MEKTTARIVVVTGAGSGIGKATAELLRSNGDEVIGVDLRGADIDVDLSNAESIAQMVAEISAQHDHIDAVVANAGTSTNSPIDLKVNYFGAVDTINALKPLLEKSDAPRVSITASAASIHPSDISLVELLLADKREEAIEYGKKLTEAGGMAGYANYAGSKRAIAQWMRSVAPTDEFAGKGIAINAVGPGVVITPMTEELLSTEEGRKRAFGAMPAPLNGGVKPESIAATHAFLISEANRSMTGQILYVDGGFAATAQGRGADIWHNPRHLDDVSKGEA